MREDIGNLGDFSLRSENKSVNRSVDSITFLFKRTYSPSEVGESAHILGMVVQRKKCKAIFGFYHNVATIEFISGRFLQETWVGATILNVSGASATGGLKAAKAPFGMVTYSMHALV